MLEGCAARHQHHRSARSLAHSVTFPYSLTRFYLHVVNYIEHYGLVRENKGAVLPAHSWNASTTFGNAVTYNLQRHSDHHASAQKPYYALESIKDAPQLPAGYPGMSRNTRLRACLRTCLLARMPRLTHPARPVVASHDVVEHGMFFSSGAPQDAPALTPTLRSLDRCPRFGSRSWTRASTMFTQKQCNRFVSRKYLFGCYA